MAVHNEDSYVSKCVEKTDAPCAILHCPHCSHSTTEKALLEEHITSVHQHVACPLCAALLSDVGRLQTHLSEAHNVSRDRATKLIEMTEIWKSSTDDS